MSHPLLSTTPLQPTLPQLKQIHAHFIKTPPQNPNHFISNLLIPSLSFPSYAISLLSFLHPPPTTPQLTNTLLKHLSRSNNNNTLLFFNTMFQHSFPIDTFTFPSLLKAVTKCACVQQGRMVHGLVCKFGFGGDPFVQSGLVGMYAGCGFIEDARLVFDKMFARDVVSWTIMIDGYCKSQLLDDVIGLLEEMRSSKLEPDSRIYTTILSACGRTRNLEIGKVVHGLISEEDVLLNSHLQCALVNMYAGLGEMNIAQNLYGKLKTKNVVLSTSMISGYSKTGNVEAGRLIFDKMNDKDLVCWSAMISGYAESDNPEEALKIFHDMQRYGIKPDQVTLLSVISACAHVGALDQAKMINKFVNENGFGKALPVNNALIDMYAKCGNLDGAKQIFSRMNRKNVISWTSIINAYAVHGDADNALRHFQLMKLESVGPNWVTFVSILYACSHAGLVEQGQKLFDSMINVYGITPKLEHYGCMIDLYGRANRLTTALKLIETMPMAPNIVIWGSLMAACRIHSELELGEFAAKRLLELDPNHDGAHVFLSNVYAKEKMWENVGVVRQLMKHNSILKERGCSMIETDNEIHKFLTADKNHKRSDEIYVKLNEVVEKLEKVGYIPNTKCVLVDVSEIEKREIVVWHSEKLALCYGLISRERQSCIRIVKNLRICEDCHNFMKLASKVFDMEIIIRDRSRFHHCRDGLCSCKDYW